MRNIPAKRVENKKKRGTGIMVKKHVILSVLILGLSACSTMQQFQSLSPQEKADYAAIADHMSIDQRKVYLSQATAEMRTAYLKELGIYDQFLEKAAFVRLDQEKQSDFMRVYLNSKPDDIRRQLASFDTSTRELIVKKDLQYGWDQGRVLLSLGRPLEVYESKNAAGTNQLWVYDGKSAPTYIYFENGQLSNWAQ